MKKHFYFNYLSLLLTLPILFSNCSSSTSKVPDKHEGFYATSDFTSVKKYDVHVHVDTDQPAFLQQAIADNFQLLTINWDDVNDPPPMEEQQKLALQQIHAFQGRIAYATTFSIRHFNDPNWQEQTL